ncbi:MAG: rubredoxin-like domain-containing protein [Phycisphaerales bacterium]
MSTRHSMPRCARCGYILAGNPPPMRCPECGHHRALRQRWLENELHREGPRVVMPVMIRCLVVVMLLVFPWILRAILSETFMDACGLSFRPSPHWINVALGPAAFMASILLTRPIGAQGAEGFGLAESSRLRPWIAVFNVPWIPFSLLMLMAIFAPTTAPNPTMRSPQDWWIAFAASLAVPSQIAWVVVLFHMGNIADYLRDALVRRIATIWCWMWGIFVVLALPVMAIRASRSQAPDAWDSLANLVITMSDLGLAWGLVMAALLWWNTTHALTLAHEELEREDRRARREQERYPTP